MIKTLIIDDEQHAINAIANQLKIYTNYRVCGTAKTLEEAIDLTSKHQPDLVFLDIVLGTKTGFDYLNAFFPNINFNIVFTTAYNNYAVKAFEYSALYYLLKPIDTDKFRDALSRMNKVVTQQEKLERLKSLEHNIEHSNNYKFIHVTTTDRHYKIKSKDIVFIKSDSNYSHFHLIDRTKITTSKTLKYYFELLRESHFFKVHKSYLVNVEQMKTYIKGTCKLIMNDETKIPVAVRKQKDFIKTFFS